MVLKQDFYIRDTKLVSLDLLGKILFHKNAAGEVLSGRIVEVEAYLGANDAAAHSFGNRRTARTQTMFLEGGHSYVYLIYGIYNCLNIVTQEEGQAEAALIRALEPTTLRNSKVSKVDLKTNGPGKLCRHLGISREHNGLKMWEKSSGLWVEDDGYKTAPSQIIKGPRIGVDYAGAAANWPLRYYLKDNAWVSKR